MNSRFEEDPFASLDRILGAIADKRVPRNLDKEALILGLRACFATHHAAAKRRSNKATKARIRRLNSIGAAAKRLKTQLVPDEIWDWSEHFWECEYIDSQLENLIDRLGWELSDLYFELKWGPDWHEAIRLGLEARTYADRWKARSPFEWLAGHYLPVLFTKQFGIRPTFHRRAKDYVPEGPLIRFVEQVLVEFGVTRSGRP
jgi:hypothetical protein